MKTFLEIKDPAAFAKAAQVIKHGEQLLSEFTQAGYPMNDTTKRRELFLPFGNGGYILRYIIKDDNVIILRAWHTRENR